MYRVPADVVASASLRFPLHQARDLRIARGATAREFEAERRSDVFTGEWVNEAVMKHLHRKMTAGH